MINVKIEEEDALRLLMDRVAVWIKDKEVTGLFEKMYQNYIDGGVFDGCEFDPSIIVDNDYINYCKTIEEGEDEFSKILAIYKEQGLGDCSCEDCGYSYIEAVDDEEEPTLFLMRC